MSAESTIYYTLLKLDKKQDKGTEFCGSFDSYEDAVEEIKKLNGQEIQIEGRTARVYWNWIILECDRAVREKPRGNVFIPPHQWSKRKARNWQGEQWWND